MATNSFLPGHDPLVSEDSTNVSCRLSDGKKLTAIVVPRLDLYIISDMDNLGPDWVQVDVVRYGTQQNHYDVKQILGTDRDDDLNTSAARFFAQQIVEKYPREYATIDAVTSPRKILFSFSLRKFTAQNIREIANYL
ncbi:uncharacterized protein LOC141857261 [Brevipalpus obovatus]|uniref:uncharacterized protein LOC141857261 n=1 Tax=Brevipalpus obovatus TaxID=246614 RepID=UPI003D9EDDC9